MGANVRMQDGSCERLSLAGLLLFGTPFALGARRSLLSALYISESVLYNMRMDSFDISKSVMSEEDIEAGLDFVADFSNTLAGYEHKLTGSDRETAAAREIRDRLQRETGEKVRLEAYKAYPMLGRSTFPFLGLWLALSYVLYFVSFAGNRVAGILLTLLALLVFATGSAVLLSLFFGNKRFKGLLSQKVSYNVVGEVSRGPRQGAERVIVIADNHDDCPGSLLKDFGVLRRLTVLAYPISTAIFVLFCVLKMAIGTSDPNAVAKITAFTVIPAVAGVFGVTVTLLHYSPFDRHSKPNNGISTCLAMATYAYFAEQPELLPEDVRVVYASFGGENSAHGGSEAFRREHPEWANAYVICIGDINGRDVRLVESDPLRKLNFDARLIGEISGAAYEQGISLLTAPRRTLSQKLAGLHGYLSNAFAANGTPSVTLSALDGETARLSDLQQLFSLSVGAVFRLMKNIPPAKQDEDPLSATTGMEIQAVQGK